MSAFPGAARPLRGAIVALGALGPVARVIVFQYNPATVTRTIQPRHAAEGGDRASALRLAGAPSETVQMEVVVDAADQLERGDPVAAATGVAPHLAALESLVHPSVADVIANAALSAAGMIEILPPEAPLTLLVWGPSRVVPVRVQDLRVTEEAHDQLLHPLRAKVALGLRVLTYDDLPLTHPGFALSLTHQGVREALAAVGAAAGLGAVGVSIA